MIPEFAIREWNETVPWTDSEQVEQDLLICRTLTEIYKDECYFCRRFRNHKIIKLCMKCFYLIVLIQR